MTFARRALLLLMAGALTMAGGQASARGPSLRQKTAAARATARRTAKKIAPTLARRLRGLPRPKARKAVTKTRKALTKTRKAVTKTRKAAPKRTRIARRPARTRKLAAAKTPAAATATATAASAGSLPIVHGLYQQIASPAQALLAEVVGSIARYGLRPKEHNPFTGELQTVALSQVEEMALGRRVVAEMIPTMGVRLTGRPMEQYLDGIVQRLVRASGIDQTTPYRFKVHLVHSDQVNAFAAPGGSIVVTTGILREMKSEAQIALILAHEIGHVVARHSSQNMAREELVKDLLTSFGLAAGNDPGAQIEVLQSAAQMKSVLLNFSREHENQSDALGVRIMARAGYSGLGVEETAAHFIGHEITHGAGDPASADHPGAAERIRNLAGVAREVGLTRAGDHGADRFAMNVTVPLALGIF